jgi:hypothetical protein
MVNPHFGNEKADMYIAGDDAEGMPCCSVSQVKMIAFDT